MYQANYHFLLENNENLHQDKKKKKKKEARHCLMGAILFKISVNWIVINHN